jgi:predicted GIY-YIG superfamily endonuclease
MREGTTRLYRQLERHLDGSLASYVAERRAKDVGWRAIAAQLVEATQVEVSHEAIRSWFENAPASPAAEPAGGQR